MMEWLFIGPLPVYNCLTSSYGSSERYEFYTYGIHKYQRISFGQDMSHLKRRFSIILSCIIRTSSLESPLALIFGPLYTRFELPLNFSLHQPTHQKTTFTVLNDPLSNKSASSHDYKIIIPPNTYIPNSSQNYPKVRKKLIETSENH